MIDSRRSNRAFTLLELLVVIGISALLLAILIPSLARVRRQGRALTCTTNVRTLCQGIQLYATASQGSYPANVSFPSPGRWWFDDQHAGGMLAAQAQIIGGAFSCPEDPGGQRSYSMNVFMSSALEKWVTQQKPTPGELWAGRARCNTILVIETWSGVSKDGNGWLSPPVVGYEGGSPGKRFGSGGGLVPFSAGRWGLVNSQIAFERHRPPGSTATGRDPVGAVHIGYADGHVELKSSSTLANPQTGLSELDSWWSPLDAAQNH